jgi:hypothetical protein
MPDINGRPEVVTLCGSMRFYDRILRVASELTLVGSIVLAPFSVVAPADQDSDAKKRLDELHLRKIDMSDRVVVVTDDYGYTGESTTREMDYATTAGKPITMICIPPTGGRP